MYSSPSTFQANIHMPLCCFRAKNQVSVITYKIQTPFDGKSPEINIVMFTCICYMVILTKICE